VVFYPAFSVPEASRASQSVCLFYTSKQGVEAVVILLNVQ